jgi:bifunctional non-homologous end joining protein LigD
MTSRQFSSKLIEKPQRPVPHPKAPPPSASLNRAARSAPRKLPVPAENILQLLPDAVVPSREALARYWTKIAPQALRHLGNRPLKLVRHVRGTTFYHRGPLPPLPSSVHQLKLHKREGGEGIRLWVDDLDGLLGLAEMGVVEVHPWGAKVDDIERPDVLVFDLDPGEGIDWEFVTHTALALREMLADEGLEAWPKLTGGKGLHLMVPIERSMLWDEAHRYCKQLAQKFADRDRARYTLSAALAARPGHLFIDYLRNGRGTTAIGAYSPRARPRFPIAAPVSWADVGQEIRPDTFTMDESLPVNARASRRASVQRSKGRQQKTE